MLEELVTAVLSKDIGTAQSVVAAVADGDIEKARELLVSAAAPDITWKTHDTYPPWVIALSQNGQLIDLANTTAIKPILKGTTGTPITGVGTKLTVATPTANTTLGSNVLTSVSLFTNVQVGGTILAAGIPAGARVASFDSAAGTITMTDNLGTALNATATASAVALTLNKGCYTYSPAATDLATVDVFSFETELTWAAGQTQTVPNSGYNTVQTVADLEGA